MCFLVLIESNLLIFLFQAWNNFNTSYFVLLESAIFKEQVHVWLWCHLFILAKIFLRNNIHPLRLVDKQYSKKPLTLTDPFSSADLPVDEAL